MSPSSPAEQSVAGEVDAKRTEGAGHSGIPDAKHEPSTWTAGLPPGSRRKAASTTKTEFQIASLTRRAAGQEPGAPPYSAACILGVGPAFHFAISAASFFSAASTDFSFTWP